VRAVSPFRSLGMARGCARIDPRLPTAKTCSKRSASTWIATRSGQSLGRGKTFSHGLGQERRHCPWPPDVGFSLTAEASLRCGEPALGAKSGLRPTTTRLPLLPVGQTALHASELPFGAESAGSGLVRRPSGLPSIADVLLRRGEPALRATSGHKQSYATLRPARGSQEAGAAAARPSRRPRWSRA
jgi:hypothetical protein